MGMIDYHDLLDQDSDEDDWDDDEAYDHCT